MVLFFRSRFISHFFQSSAKRFHQHIVSAHTTYRLLVIFVPKAGTETSSFRFTLVAARSPQRMGGAEKGLRDVHRIRAADWSEPLHGGRHLGALNSLRQGVLESQWGEVPALMEPVLHVGATKKNVMMPPCSRRTISYRSTSPPACGWRNARITRSCKMFRSAFAFFFCWCDGALSSNSSLFPGLLRKQETGSVQSHSARIASFATKGIIHTKYIFSRLVRDGQSNAFRGRGSPVAVVAQNFSPAS